MKIIRTPSLLVKISTGVPYTHVVVSKKVAPKAVQRNRIKRWIKESILVNNISTAERGMTVTALPLILGKKFQEIKEEMKQVTKNL